VLKLTNQIISNKNIFTVYTDLAMPFRPVRANALVPDNLNELRLQITLDWVLRLLKFQNPNLMIEFGDIDEKIDLAVTRGAAKANQTAKIGNSKAENEQIIVGQELAVLRYYLAGFPYSQSLEWQPEALTALAGAIKRLKDYAARFQAEAGDTKPNQTTLNTWRKRFVENLENDLDTIRMLPNIWLMLQAKLPPADSLALLVEFDHLLGLGIVENNPVTKRYWEQFDQPAKPIQPNRANKPDRTAKPTGKASKHGNKAVNSFEVQAKPKVNKPEEENVTRKKIHSSREINSHLREANRFDFTVSLVVSDNLPEIRATLNSLIPYLNQTQVKAETVIVDMNSQANIGDFLEDLRKTHRNIKVVWAAQNLGEAAGRNIALKQAHGRFLLSLTAGTIIKNNLFETILSRVKGEQAGLYGLNPVKVGENDYTALEIKSKQALHTGEALDGSLLCWERQLTNEVGFMDERFRHPYALGLDYSYNFYDKNLKVIALPELLKTVQLPDAFPNYGLDEIRQKPRNWNIFLQSWQENSDR
jgi:Glycosyl transferase family 2